MASFDQTVKLLQRMRPRPALPIDRSAGLDKVALTRLAVLQGRGAMVLAEEFVKVRQVGDAAIGRDIRDRVGRPGQSACRMGHALTIDIVGRGLGQEFAHGAADVGMHAARDAGKTRGAFAENLRVPGCKAGGHQPFRRMRWKGGDPGVTGRVERGQKRQEKGLGGKGIARRGVKPGEKTGDISLSGASGRDAVGFRTIGPEEPSVQFVVTGDKSPDHIGMKGGHDDFGHVAPALERVNVLWADENEVALSKVIDRVFEVMPGPP